MDDSIIVNVLDVGSANQRFSGGLNNIESKRVIGFEPDTRTLAENDESADVGNIIYPYALAGRNEMRKLNLTRKPECSSFYSPNRNYVDLFPEKERWDIVDHDYHECKTLDSLKLVLGDCDFLTIDTQGSEIEIIKGAEGDILNNLLGIECEVEFIEIYKDQPLFGDVCKYLNQQGFEFYEFVTEYRYNRIKLDRTGQLAFADALFLRTPEYIYRKYMQGIFCSDKIEKYKVIVEAYGKNDLAVILDQYIDKKVLINE